MNIVVIGTLDTKGDEVAYIRNRILEANHIPIVIDPGSGGEPTIPADVDRETVALASGESLASLLAANDRAHCQSQMIAGLVNVVSEMYVQGKVDGVIAVGGGQGTAIATAPMRALPVGVPKVMISTVACGKTTFGPYVGTKDIMMIHSVADISGLNFVTREIIAQATAAVVAMAAVKLPKREGGELIALTQAGVTTPGVVAIKSQLESLGFEVIVFHCNGIGGQAMEDLMKQGAIQGVIDFSPHEITDFLYDGLMPAMPGRMTVAGQMGIPQVVAPGCADVLLHEWRDDFPPELSERALIRHTPTHTHFRTTPDEMSAVANYIVDALNQGSGPRAVIVPLQGFSMLNQAGKPLYDETANLAFVETMREAHSPGVQLIEIDAHINDAEFAQATVQLFLDLRDKYREKMSD